jgi:hypothetical protein
MGVIFFKNLNISRSMIASQPKMGGISMKLNFLQNGSG